ncbi:GNAT family N-acetyltransferase [Paludibacterium purpuratum]|uniref:Mig-14 protein n=1 Tax=Paludibacterium purpuratum TaxID=1144873 RepID=A0A4R7B8A9_9NEIS|nr:GNAT family N-acetyltransferase [Paludibacterium purpuratum]TDR80773.1 Mig-14 protein [Paludibacterium purpuratum]
MPAFLRSLGWQPISPDTYAVAWHRFGGSVITHPKVLAFIQEHCDCKPQYLGRHDRAGNLLAAVATWGNYLAGDKTALEHFGVDRQYDFGSPEVILPLGPAYKGMLCFRGKYVSSEHAGQLINLSGRNRGRTICLAKDLSPQGMSAKQKGRRRSELNRCLKSQGRLQPAAEYAPEELVRIYAELYQKRWGQPLPNQAQLAVMLQALRAHIDGYVLLIEDRPAAFQLLFATQSDRFYSVEYINGGVDPAFHDLSPGTVLTWANVEHTWQNSQSLGLAHRYSFGRNSAEYKTRWANESKLMRIVSW